jgi:hypothetical protein
MHDTSHVRAGCACMKAARLFSLCGDERLRQVCDGLVAVAAAILHLAYLANVEGVA